MTTLWKAVYEAELVKQEKFKFFKFWGLFTAI